MTLLGSASVHVEADRGFWAAFADTVWERDVLHLDAAATAATMPTVQPHELFAAVVACIDDHWRSGEQKVRFYVGQGVQLDLRRRPNAALLPVAADRDFERYAARLRRLGVAEFGLVVADWHQFHRPAWERILMSLHEMVAHMPISGSRMDTQIFVGNYRTTPFGVHVDDTGGFHFPVIGRKTMRFWSPEVIAARPALRGSMRYDTADSTCITAEAGESMYWPSNRWHVAESDGSLSVTWGCGYWFGDGMQRMVLDLAAEHLTPAACSTPVLPGRSALAAAGSNTPVHELIDEVAQFVHAPQVADRVTEGWLRHQTGYGFRRIPRRRALTVGEDDRVTRRLPLPVIATRLHDGALCLAAMGCTCVIPYEPAVVAAVEQLDRGAAVSPVDAADIDARGALRAALTFLRSAGIVDLA